LPDLFAFFLRPVALEFVFKPPLAAFSLCAPPRQQDLGGFEENDRVQHNRQMLNIEEVVFELDPGLLDARPISAPDLGPAGYPGAQRMPLIVVGDFLFQHTSEIWLFGPGTNQAHIAEQHVDQLRDFVKSELADEPADPGYARVLIGGPGLVHWGR